MTDLDLAEERLAARDYRAAHGLCIAALERNPREGRAFMLLGVLAADHDNHAKAVELFDRAAAAGAPAGRTLAFKSRSLIALNRREDAVRAAEAAAAAVSARDALAQDTIGVAFSRAGLHGRAVGFYERAVAAKPGDHSFQYNLGAALQFLGRMDEAREAYRRSARLDPSNARALAAAAQLTRQTPEENDIEALREAFERVKRDPDAALQIGHAVAKAYEDLGEPREAFRWLGEAKAGKRAALSPDGATSPALFDQARGTLDLPRAGGFEAAEPIFVVGLPRTGTTLVDRILSSHSAVSSAGELTDFGLRLKRLAGTPSPYVLDAETLHAAAGVDARALGEAYARGVTASLGLAGRFIDKMPLNFFYAPLILRALPNARVIRLKRHPADAMLSNYRQLFATGFSYYDYAYDLEETARYVARFEALMAAFAAALPSDRYAEVAYEDVVADIEGETRRLLAFCGLDFEEACLAFHENAAPVATASSAQVRRPLYSSSVGRWRTYRPEIDPGLRILKDAGLLSADDLA